MLILFLFFLYCVQRIDDGQSLVKGANESTTADKAESFKAMGRAFVKDPPPMAHRLLFLNETWRVVTQLTDAQKYTSVCAVFVDLLARYYTERELLVVLKGARALQLVLTACFSGLLVFAHSRCFLLFFSFSFSSSSTAVRKTSRVTSRRQARPTRS